MSQPLSSAMGVAGLKVPVDHGRRKLCKYSWRPGNAHMLLSFTRNTLISVQSSCLINKEIKEVFKNLGKCLELALIYT